MKQKTTKTLVLFLLLCGACTPERHAEIWITTGDGSKLLSREPDVRIESPSQSKESNPGVTMTIDLQTCYQQMIGFGGAICDNSA